MHLFLFPFLARLLNTLDEVLERCNKMSNFEEACENLIIFIIFIPTHAL